MLTLHLIRHAKTKQESETGKDVHRELMEKGIAQANMLGNYLQVHHIEMGTILCSSATRTRQTLSILSHQFPADHKVDLRDSLYLADYRQLLNEIANEESRIVTLIGHNEGISDLASYLTDEQIQMRTSELITLDFPFESWNMISQGTGILSLRYRAEVFLP